MSADSRANPVWLVAPRDGEANMLALASQRSAAAQPRTPLVVLGGNTDADHARKLGLSADAAVSTVAGRWQGAGKSLADLLRANGWTSVVPFGPTAAAVAQRAVQRSPALQVALHDASVHGVSLRSLASRLAADRAEIRRGLALQPGEQVIVPVADDPRTIDAARFAFLLGVLDLMGRPTVAIIPTAARNTAGAFRFARSARLSLRLLLADAPLASLTVLADIALTDRAMTPGDRAIDCTDTRRLLMDWIRACGARVEGDPRLSAPKRPIPEVTHTLRWASTTTQHATP